MTDPKAETTATRLNCFGVNSGEACDLGEVCDGGECGAWCMTCDVSGLALPGKEVDRN